MGVEQEGENGWMMDEQGFIESEGLCLNSDSSPIGFDQIRKSSEGIGRLSNDQEFL